MNGAKMLSQQQLKQALHYDPETGIFTRLSAGSRSDLVGKPAGSVSKRGYCCIRIGAVIYKAHRLAFLYMTGAWPKVGVDHKNPPFDDNRWSNLREADQRENNWNARLRKDNRARLKGAHLVYGRWQAAIKIDGRTIHLGMFGNAQDAHAAYVAAACRLRGEFARAE